MKLTALTDAALSGFTGQATARPELRAMAAFSDGYTCQIVFTPSDAEPVILMRREGRGWSRNMRPSAERLALVEAAVFPVWCEAVAQAQQRLSQGRTWQEERAGYFRKARAGEGLHAALSRVLAEGLTAEVVVQAEQALKAAEGEGLRTFYVVDADSPHVRRAATGLHPEQVLRDFEMSLDQRPRDGRYSVVEESTVQPLTLRRPNNLTEKKA